MNLQLEKLSLDIKTIRTHNNPVAYAWNQSFEIIGVSDSKWRGFGHLFLNHPDLRHSTNEYHNEYHTAEAVISASYLARQEFDKITMTHSAPILLFSMLCHDIAHTGQSNTQHYELEKKAIHSLDEYVKTNPEIKEYWNEHLEKDYGNWNNFSKIIESVILNTDFEVGPKENAKNYQLGETFSQIKMLSNEADILPSCLAEFGPERAVMLAHEQSDPSVGSWRSREFFLENLVTYKSNASKRLEIDTHIQAQLDVIKFNGIEFLEHLTQSNGLENVVNDLIAEIKLAEGSLKLEKLREMIGRHPAEKLPPYVYLK